MSLKDVLGMVLVCAGVVGCMLGARILGSQWYFAACAALVFGILVIWSARRDQKIHDALDEVPDHWGDRHYISGVHDTDDLDTGADDGHH